MKFSVLIMFSILFCSSYGFSQVNKFRFDVDGEQYLSIKKNAGGFNTIHQHNNQTSMFFGFNSGKNTVEDPTFSSSADNNTAYGFSSLEYNTTGFRNTAIGSSTMRNNTTGFENVAIGISALNRHTTGYNNIGIGVTALYKMEDGNFNVAIGTNALYNSISGIRSVAVGGTAGINDSSSVDNVYLGFGTGRGTVFATDGYDRFNNVMVGSLAGYYCQTNGNVFLGYGAGRDSKADNQLYITNSSTDSLNSLIYGQFDNEFLRINGELNIDGLYTLPTTAPSSGQYLRYSGGSNLGWGAIDAPWSIGSGDDVLYEDGDVGIGVGNAIYRLDVQDNLSTGYVAKFRNSNTGSSSRGIIIQAGPIINPSSSVYYAIFLDGNGTNIGGIRGNSAGGTMYSTTSDRRLKQNIKTFENGLATLDKINPAIYQMKSNPTQDEIGFIAQELQKVLPLVVGGNPSDDVEESPMTVDYGRITPVLVAAIKEQQIIIKDQQKVMQELMARLDNQDKEFSQMKAEIMKMQGMAEK